MFGTTRSVRVTVDVCISGVSARWGCTVYATYNWRATAQTCIRVFFRYTILCTISSITQVFPYALSTYMKPKKCVEEKNMSKDVCKILVDTGEDM